MPHMCGGSCCGGAVPTKLHCLLSSSRGAGAHGQQSHYVLLHCIAHDVRGLDWMDCDLHVICHRRLTGGDPVLSMVVGCSCLAVQCGMGAMALQCALSMQNRCCPVPVHKQWCAAQRGEIQRNTYGQYVGRRELCCSVFLVLLNGFCCPYCWESVCATSG